MPRIAVLAMLWCLALGLAGCTSAAATRLQRRPAAAAALDPATREKIEQGVVEPGFTPEMVYFALGQPTAPFNADIDQMRDGVWKYSNPRHDDRDFIRAGWRQRKVFDPDRRSDVMIIEPVDERAFPHLRDYTLEIEFRDGRVASVRKVQL